ncbi:MAG TPA: class II aldolase/adducin family protein, partial [bacterium]|nr:class II aldolase/adducin family protein [bacterium]
MKALHEIKQDIVRICGHLDTRQYVGGRDGNVSARISESTILITPAGMRKGDIQAADLLVIDRSGKRIEGRGQPSTETGMHVNIYDARPDVRAIVHAHPPAATGFAAAGRGITGCVLPEVIVGLGEVPVVPYALPGTEEVFTTLAPILPGHDAFLLANHGVVTVGTDVELAYQRMETVEQSAR